MSEVSKMIFVDGDAGKDRLNVLKTKGADTIVSTVDIVDGVYENPDSIIQTGKNIQDFGLKWCMKLGMLPLYKNILSETGSDNRMFVRKAERGGFENLHKLFTKLSETGVSPDFVQIDSEMYTEMPGISISFEEQTRMINSIINAVKAVNPSCKIAIETKDSFDNEKSKKWFNRFQVSGGKKFDIITLTYELASETFYDLTCNMSDLSRRFEADIIVDISMQEKPEDADVSIEDLGSAIGIVPLDRGFGAIYSESELDKVSKVA